MQIASPVWWVRVFAIALVIPVMTGCQPTSVVIGLAPNVKQLTETRVGEDSRTSQKVAIIDVSGTIMNAHRPGLLVSGSNPVGDLHEQLEKAKHDKQVVAVLLRINSPGGGVTASDAMYRDIVRFREQTGKPVVAVLMDVAASGGYYVACATDRIVAYPTSVTGSVGVLIQLVSLKPALDRIGVNAVTLTSGDMKAAGSPFTELEDGQRETLQRLVDQFYERFVAVVRNRPRADDAKPANIDGVIDGRVVSGIDAKDAGLVDETGDVYDAWRLAKLLAGVESAHLVRYHRPLDYVASPYAGGGVPVTAGGTQINLAQFNLDGGLPVAGSTSGFYYLWSAESP